MGDENENFTCTGERKIYAVKKLRMARLKRRITQSNLAARVQLEGITLERDSISRIEKGTRFVTDYELKTFSKILGVSMEWLTTEDAL